MTYQQLLQQLLTQDLPALRAAWASVQQSIAATPSNSPCQGLSGSPSLVPALQQISVQACTIAHNAAVSALGYTLGCNSVGAQNALNAQNATQSACVLGYAWQGSEAGPYGTVYITGNPSGTCLDTTFVNAVGTQVAAAAYAVGQAQAVMAACIAYGGGVNSSAPGENVPRPSTPAPIYTGPGYFKPVPRSAIR